MQINIYHIDALIVSVLLFWLWSRVKARRRNPQGLPLPPGPKGLPVIGNVLQMPLEKAWLVLADWGKKYGDVVYVENLGKPLIILNSYVAVSDLLDKRSSIYSDRPSFPMLNDVMGYDWMAVLMPYGSRYQKHRQQLHRFFQSTEVIKYRDLQMRETHRLVLDLLESHDFVHHLRRAAGAIIMMIAYGHEVASKDDFYVRLAEEAVASLGVAAQPGAFLVDVISWLKYVPAWFPGARFKRLGNMWYKQSQTMLKVPYAMTKESIENGTATSPSMISQLLETNADEDGRIHDEDIIAGSAAVAYIGGSDTIVSSLTSFVLAMVLYPDVQKRAQEEIDRVVGVDRLPNFEDRPSLPYIEGIVRESLRWNPVLPLGVPHFLMMDDVYNGYFIPAGCTVIANQWSLLHDETEYPDPLSFRPERWLPTEGNASAEPRHPDKGAFGFGRRLCPGKHLAEQSIYIGVVSILATLNIDKAVDKDSKPIIPPVDFCSGMVSFPEPFECSITSRTSEAIALVQQAVDSDR